MSSKSYTKLQDGIYFSSTETPPMSFCLVMLRVSPSSDVTEVGNAIKNLWRLLSDLENGIIPDLNINARHRRKDGLSVLVGYNSKMFDIPGIRRECPTDLKHGLIYPPLGIGGGEVVENSSLRYANDITENQDNSAHILLQIIADTEFATTRAVVEIWKEIQKQRTSNESKFVLNLSNVYTGFQSPNKRNWLGFHDGVSNIRADQRLKAIAIDSASLSKQDQWISGGTYLAFLRMGINLELWDRLNISEQEIIIGRDKLTGCPLIGVDRYNKPVKDKRCPIRGTFEVIEHGNEQFRIHPPYGYQKNKPYGVKDEVLKYSHIGLTKQSDAFRSSKISQIFRQGFQFFELTNDNQAFRVGMNFVSFQKSVQTIHKMLKYGFPKITPLGSAKQSLTFSEILSVRSAGIFLVPPSISGEFFPGESIFSDVKSSDRANYQYRLDLARPK